MKNQGNPVNKENGKISLDSPRWRNQIDEQELNGIYFWNINVTSTGIYQVEFISSANEETL